eukprot:gene2748-8601_t
MNGVVLSPSFRNRTDSPLGDGAMELASEQPTAAAARGGRKGGWRCAGGTPPRSRPAPAHASPFGDDASATETLGTSHEGGDSLSSSTLSCSSDPAPPPFFPRRHPVTPPRPPPPPSAPPPRDEDVFRKRVGDAEKAATSTRA